MDTTDLLRRACETNFGYLALGNDAFQAHGAWFIRNDRTPRRHDANGVGLIRTESDEELELLLQRVEQEYAVLSHRGFGIDALAPPQAEARIALEEGYKTTSTLVHALEGELRLSTRLGSATPAEIEIREVLTEDDWTAYCELDAMWWEESGVEYFGPYDADLHDELTLSKRLKSPQSRAWLACVDGVPRAFFSSWPGENGVGIVEDLFCNPQYRRRGLATALIARAVADCRERGAGSVIINSDVNDTPKQMYAAMGFRPLFVNRVYAKKLDAKKDAS
jgi:GNAT superfamily N-acetyltransferase